MNLLMKRFPPPDHLHHSEVRRLPDPARRERFAAQLGSQSYLVTTETLDVEYDDEVGLLGVRIAQRMGPTMVLVVRKWQPFNGLEVFTPN